MAKKTLGRGGRVLDTAATKEARERHAAGVARLQKMCAMPKTPVPPKGARGQAEKRWRRALATPAPNGPVRLPTKAMRRRKTKAQRRARRKNR